MEPETGKKADVVILQVPYEKTASFAHGTIKGPEAIMNCLNTQIELYDRYSDSNPVSSLAIDKPDSLPVADLPPEEFVVYVSKEIEKRIKKNQFVIALGGEHTLTTAIMDAWSKDKKKDSITILQIDAHFDLRETDGDYNPEDNKIAHSTCMKRSLDMGFNIVPVGIRAYADFELDTAKEHKLKYFEWPQEETKDTIKKIIDAIKTDNVYLTLDVDGIDPAHMPGTGTPVQGGLGWYFTLDLLKALFKEKNVVGADIVEVSPQPHNQLTEYGAAQLLYSMMGFKFKNSTQ